MRLVFALLIWVFAKSAVALPPPQALVRPLSNSAREIPVHPFDTTGEFTEGLIYSDLDIDTQPLREIVRNFDQGIYPRFVRDVIPDPLRATRGQNKIILLFDSLKGKFPAYHSRALASTHRDIILIDIDSVLNSNFAKYYLPHELQHVFRFHLNPREDDWLNEGLSKFAEFFANGREFPVGYFKTFESSVGLSLTANDLGPMSSSSYFNNMFFVYYLFQHFGGLDLVRDLMTSPLSGIANVNAALAKARAKETNSGLKSYYTFEKVFTNYELALLLNPFSSRLESGGLWDLKLDQDTDSQTMFFKMGTEDLPMDKTLSLKPASTRYFSLSRRCVTVEGSPSTLAVLVDLEAPQPVRILNARPACVETLRGSGQYLILLNLAGAGSATLR